MGAVGSLMVTLGVRGFQGVKATFMALGTIARLTATTLLRGFGGAITSIIGSLVRLSARVAGFIIGWGSFIAGFASVGALAAGFMAVVHAAGAFEHGMQQVRAVMDEVTNKQFAEMTKMAEHLGETTIFTATEAAKGFETLARAGFTAEQQLASIGAVLDLASAEMLTMDEAATIVIDTLGQFQMGVEKATYVADLLAQASIIANVSVHQLAESIRFAGAAAEGINIPLEEMVKLFTAVANAGIRASQAGVGFQRVISTLLAPSKEASRLMFRLGIDFRSFADGTQTLTDTLAQLGVALKRYPGAALDIFGMRCGRVAQAAAQTMAETMRKYGKALEDVTGTVQKIAQQRLDSLVGSVMILKSAWDQLLITLGTAGGENSLIGRLTRLVRQTLIPLVSGLSRWAKESEGLIPILARLWGIVKLLGSDIAKFAASIWLTIKALLSTPKDMFEGGVFGLFGDLLTNTFVKAATTAGLALIAALVSVLGRGLVEIVTMIDAALSDLGNAIMGDLINDLKSGINVLIDGLVWMHEQFIKLASVPWFSEKLGFGPEFVENTNGAIAALKGMKLQIDESTVSADSASEAIGTRLREAMKNITIAVQTDMQNTLPMIRAFVGDMGQGWEALGDTLQESLLPHFQSLTTALDLLTKGDAAKGIDQIWQEIKVAMAGIGKEMDKVREEIDAADTKFQSSVGEGAIAKFFNASIQGARAFIAGMLTVVNQVPDIYASLSEAGESFATQLQTSLSKNFTDLLFPDKKMFHDAEQAIDDYIHAYNINWQEGMRDALREFKQSGVPDADQWADKLEEAATLGFTDKRKNQFTGLGAINKLVEQMFGEFAEQTEFAHRIKRFFGGFANAVEEGFKDVITDLLARETIRAFTNKLANMISTGNEKGDAKPMEVSVTERVTSLFDNLAFPFFVAIAAGLSPLESILVTIGLNWAADVAKKLFPESMTTKITEAMQWVFKNTGVGVSAFGIFTLFGASPLASAIVGGAAMIVEAILQQFTGRGFLDKLTGAISNLFAGNKPDSDKLLPGETGMVLDDVGSQAGSKFGDGFSKGFSDFMKGAGIGAMTGALSDVFLGTGKEGTIGGTIGGGFGALIGSAIPGVGSTLGAFGGSIIGTAIGSLFNDSPNKLEKVKRQMDRMGAAQLLALIRQAQVDPIGVFGVASEADANELLKYAISGFNVHLYDAGKEMGLSGGKFEDTKIKGANQVGQSLASVRGLKIPELADLTALFGSPTTAPIGIFGGVPTVLSPSAGGKSAIEKSPELTALENIVAILEAIRKDAMGGMAGSSPAAHPALPPSPVAFASPTPAPIQAPVFTPASAGLERFNISSNPWVEGLIGTGIHDYNGVRGIFERDGAYAIFRPMQGGMASGGPVSRTGPIMAHRGEFMMDADTVARVGMDTLRGIQNGGRASGGGDTYYIEAVDAASFEEWLRARGGGQAMKSYMRSESQNGQWFLHDSGVRS